MATAAARFKTLVDAAVMAIAVPVGDDDPLKGVLELKEELGRGAFGRVYRAVDCASQTSVAVKIVEGGDGEAFARSEVEALTQLRGGPFIADLRWHVQTRSRHYIVLGLGEGGTLFDRVMARGPLREPELSDAVAALLHAVNYAHMRGVAHFDIKLDNILVDIDGRVQALADWGFATTTGKQRVQRGTMEYAAPELLNCEEVMGWAVDIYAVGVCCFAMASGTMPFPRAPTASMMYRYVRELKCDWVTLGASSLTLVDLVQRCLSFDPRRRPSAAQLLRQHLLTRPQPPLAPPLRDDVVLCVN